MLLNRHNLNIAKLVSDERSRFTLNAINVTPNETVVTDGHLLMRVARPKLEDERFPYPDGLHAPDAEFKPFNVAADTALKAMKDLPKRSNLPILQCAAVAVNDDPNTPKLLTTDLERLGSYPAVEGNFPDWQRVMPKLKDTTFAIRVDARKMAQLMAQFCDAIPAGKHHAPACVTLRFRDARSGIRMDAKTENDQDMTGILMPVSIDKGDTRAHDRMVTVDRLMREYQDSTDARRADILDEVAKVYREA